MNYPFPVFFCRKVPLERLTFRSDQKNYTPPETEWFKALCADIEKNGLASPLLVLHYVRAEVVPKPLPMQVKTGQNRLRVLRKLKWKYAPCIIVCKKDGPIPEDLEDLIPLQNSAEVQPLLGDGIICWEKHESLRIGNARMPEQGVYPDAKVRYFDVV